MRTRFVAAVFALVFLVCGGFYFTVYQFVEVLEAQLMENAVKRELHELADGIRAGMDAPLHHSAGMRAFVWKPGEDAPEGLPLPLQTWNSGTLGEIEIAISNVENTISKWGSREVAASAWPSH